MGMEQEEAKLIALCKGLHRLAGVSGTWLLFPSEHEADLYVTVSGFDELALRDQMTVYRAVEKFREAARSEMDAHNLAFNYRVLTDDEIIGDPLIPSGAKQIN